MPIYEYQCLDCGNKEEVLIYNKEKITIKCNKCNKTMKKIPSLSSFRLNGTCWSNDGYANKNYSILDNPPK